MKISVLFLLLAFFGNAQTQIRGKVTDKSTGQGLPYVSIGISGKAIGTVGDESGHFDFIADNFQPTDSLKFMAIGYKSKSLMISQIGQKEILLVQLENTPLVLEEVVVNPKILKYKKLGTTRYSKNNCTGFSDVGGNWKGSEAAVLLRNNKEIKVETFSFFVIQNKYSDSLVFRLKFYGKLKNDWVGPLLNKMPVVFKIGPGQGEFTIPLKDYNLFIRNDFFVSLECLMNEMDVRKFCYSGSIRTPSYYKVKAFSKWHSTTGTGNGGGGADFNLTVSYSDQ